MSKRKGITASLRWKVFARDGFTCRYCGVQAGQDGVELAVDHVVSVADCGFEDNRFDNLVAACRKCNGGKGAISLKNAPTSQEVVDRIEERARTLKEQSDAMKRAMEAEKELEQNAINLKCEAYGVDRIILIQGEAKHITNLCRAYGPDKVLDWYGMAARRGVSEARTIKYVYGVIRNLKEQGRLQVIAEANQETE